MEDKSNNRWVPHIYELVFIIWCICSNFRNGNLKNCPGFIPRPPRALQSRPPPKNTLLSNGTERKMFMESILSSNFFRKCNRFSVTILHMRLKLNDWCHNWHGLKWRIKLDKLLSWFISPCFIKLEVVWLCIFVLLCNLPHTKTKGSLYNAHLHFRS